jgi:flagellar biosynthesis GTPase FlhF
MPSDVIRSSELARDEGRKPDIRTYRGSDLDELLPRIREELGPDAIVIRQREGLDGGFGGFFQKRCVEVVARRATPGLDAYDASSSDAVARDVAPEPPAPAIAEIMRVASPFIEQLRAAEVAVAEPQVVDEVVQEPDEEVVEEQRVEEQQFTGAFGTTAYAMTAGGATVAVAPVVDQPPVAPAPPLQLVPRTVVEPEPEPESDPEPEVRAPAAAAQERTLVAAGIAPQLAAELVRATISHVLAFEPRRTLKRALREALARRIPLSPPVAAGGRAIAFVGAGGSGKSLCAARLAAAYTEHSDLAVSIVTLDAPAAERPAAGDRTMTVIDTAAVSPGSPADVKRLATALRRLGRPEVHVTVPATLSGNAVRALLDGFAVLKPTAIVLTHLDEVGHAGPVIDEAIARGIAISYTSDGSAADGFAPTDPAALAARVLA